MADSTVDPAEVDPLDRSSLVAFVNCFVADTCAFLATFAAECEDRYGRGRITSLVDFKAHTKHRLEEHAVRMQRMEAGIAMLENKLSN